MDDRYFARLGEENAARSADLPPSQGGKYSGFGNTPAPGARTGNEAGLPDFTDIQRDAIATVTKGWGWFTNTVKNVNTDYIQPTAKQVRTPSFYGRLDGCLWI